MEIARALLYRSKVPIAYWGEYLLTATHLINRLLSKVLKEKIPYFILFNQSSYYSTLRVFGYLCYVSILSNGRSKFDPRAKACVFLDYPLGQKGYKVLKIDTRKVIVFTDVQFYENKYPFASNYTSPHLVLSNDPSEDVIFPIYTHHLFQNLFPMYLHHQLQTLYIHLTIMAYLNLVPLPKHIFFTYTYHISVFSSAIFI